MPSLSPTNGRGSRPSALLPQPIRPAPATPRRPLPRAARWLALGALALSPCASASQEARAESGLVERRVAAMGTWLEIGIHATEVAREAALAASERACEAVRRVEGRLSTWRDDSELAQLNAAPVREWTPISAELAADLRTAFTWRDETRGAFDPRIGALVELWKLRDGGGPRPAADDLRACRERLLEPGFELEPARARRLDAGLWIEEGGFGKGIGLDAARAELRTAGFEDSWLNLGGQLALCGSERTESFAVAHPTDRLRPLLSLVVDRGSVATSGNSERGIVVGGERLGHILDPRTGEPAPDFGSLTVWAPDASSADCLSTGLYVLGPDRALEWARHRAGIEVLVVETRAEGLRVRATGGFGAALATGERGPSIEWIDTDTPLSVPTAASAPRTTDG